MGGNLTWEAPSDPTHAAWREAPETRDHLVGGFRHVFFGHIVGIMTRIILDIITVFLGIYWEYIGNNTSN